MWKKRYKNTCWHGIRLTKSYVQLYKPAMRKRKVKPVSFCFTTKSQLIWYDRIITSSTGLTNSVCSNSSLTTRMKYVSDNNLISSPESKPKRASRLQKNIMTNYFIRRIECPFFRTSTDYGWGLNSQCNQNVHTHQRDLTSLSYCRLQHKQCSHLVWPHTPNG